MYKVTNKSTAHGSGTPHGYKTPHRYPSKTSNSADLLNLAIQLYPTGRAWWLPENSNLANLHAGLNVSLLRLANDAYGIIDSSFPDNESFDDSDADFWENIYGIAYNPALTIQQRRAVLYQRMAYPNNILPRQSHTYIEAQLRQAGFNVHVYENIFYDIFGIHYYKTPADILGTMPGNVQHGGTTQHGGSTEHGGGNFEVIANKLDEESYSPGGVLWPTFFIAGDLIDQTATISLTRKTEFRELVLKLKPAHTVAYIFINYV